MFARLTVKGPGFLDGFLDPGAELGIFGGPFFDPLAQMEARFGGVTDSVALGFPASTPAGLVREVVQDVRRIPCAFRAFPGRRASA